MIRINLFYMIIILLSLASCEEKQNKKYQLDFGINNIKLSQTKDKSSYYLFINGYLENKTPDSIYSIPYTNGSSGERNPSYIVANLGNLKINFKKIGGTGYLKPNESCRVYFYSEIKEKDCPVKYLMANFAKVRFSFEPVSDSTTYFCLVRERYFEYRKYGLELDTMEYRFQKDSVDMHFVNSMRFNIPSNKLRIKIIEPGRDDSSIFM